MNQIISIRSESIDDINIIENITIEAFKNHPHSKQNEHNIITKLRDNEALAVSLVATIDNTIVGHIAFSEVKINNEFVQWYGLAPVSVKPEYQNQGIGSKLIFSGLDAIKALNAKGCVLLGEPEYYNKFGFKAFDGLFFKGVPPKYFQALLIRGEVPLGNIEYHGAFA